jgi:hypothetical protein
LNPLKLLLAALAFAVLLHVAGAVAVFGLIHDEALSYLASTGHMGEYEQACQREAYPIGRWVGVAEWRRFLEVEDRFVFGRISRDLAALDRHPPLYFWLLHLWLLAFGTAPPAARLLGVALNLAIAALLGGIAWRLLRDRAAALAAACLWLLSPTALRSALTIRHYGLFALLALAFAYLLWRRLHAPSGRLQRGGLSLALVLVVLAGLLTHYQFLLVLGAGAVAFAAVSLATRGPARLAGDLALLAAHGALAAALLLLLDGHYLQPVLESVTGQGGEQLVAFPRVGQADWSSGPPSLAGVLERPIAYFVPESLWHAARAHAPLRFAVGALFFVGVVLAGCLLARPPDAAAAPAGDAGALRSLALFMGSVLLGFWGALVALYLTGYSPVHTMGDYRYFTPVGVFVPLVLLGLLQARPLAARRWPLAGALLAVMAASSAFTLVRESRNHPSVVVLRAIAASPRGAGSTGRPPHILVDNLVRGGIFTLVRWLPEDSLVYYAARDALRSHPGGWAPRLGHEGGFYVPLDTRSGRPEQPILDALGALVSVEPLHPRRVGPVYRLTAREPS